MNTKIVSKGMDLPYGDLDELNEFFEDSEYVPMSIPILKHKVWIAVKDDCDPQGHRWVAIDKWMPLGSLYRFKDFKWIPLGDTDADEEDWIPFEDLIDIHEDEETR